VSSAEKWWTWRWDHTQAVGDLVVKYSALDRWRRGWVTLYKFVSTFNDGHVQTEWRLYLPFNVSVSVQFNKEML
jgi:hypothetical protein